MGTKSLLFWAKEWGSKQLWNEDEFLMGLRETFDKKI